MLSCREEIARNLIIVELGCRRVVHGLGWVNYSKSAKNLK